MAQVRDMGGRPLHQHRGGLPVDMVHVVLMRDEAEDLGNDPIRPATGRQQAQWWYYYGHMCGAHCGVRSSRRLPQGTGGHWLEMFFSIKVPGMRPGPCGMGRVRQGADGVV